MTAQELRAKLNAQVPSLWSSVNSIAQEWSDPIVASLERMQDRPTGFPKTFTDPVLGTIELFEWEVILLDSPLLQRLRGVRQLGMAHSVYPGATHDRLSHCLGVVEVADRMIRALHKNAEYHQQFGRDADDAVPLPTSEDRYALRLAALLHDIGHGPFSHATEPMLEEAAAVDFDVVRTLFRETFSGAAEVKTSEALAVLIILSEPMRKVFEHARFSMPFSRKDALPFVLAARILGSREELAADYIAGVINGAVDADKLDYMARDSYFSGLPIGLDVDRLISKLEVISITPERANNPELRKRAEEARNSRLYELGISVSGLTAYEQMIIGRVLLFDRVYYHQKVRCAEAMVRLLLALVAKEQGSAFSISELLTNISDDGLIFVLAGGVGLGLKKTKISSTPHKIATKLQNRQFYHRAFAFAERFIAGLDDLEKQEQRDTRSALWQTVLEDFDEATGSIVFGDEIFALAQELRAAIPEVATSGDFTREDVVVDLPDDKPTIPISGPFLRTDSGDLTTANLFFNPDKWSEAYKTQKKVGYVFAAREHAGSVAMAAEIVCFEKYGLIMLRAARQLCKMERRLSDIKDWKKLAFEAKLCTPECFAALSAERPRLLRFRSEDFRVPSEWVTEDPDIKQRLVNEFFVAFPGGVVSSIHEAVADGFEHLCRIISTVEKNGQFVQAVRPDEKKDLQSEILKLLKARGCDAREGQELAGGETDIILPGELVVENKVAEKTANIESLKPDAAWQARRYSISLNRRISFVVIAYQPANEAALPSLPNRVKILPIENTTEESAYIRFLIPWGHGTPSTAKAIRTPAS
jgi:HD superfamily phosphohydrolase